MRFTRAGEQGRRADKKFTHGAGAECGDGPHGRGAGGRGLKFVATQREDEAPAEPIRTASRPLGGHPTLDPDRDEVRMR